jgi:predicted ABC-type transport system involved in lysophospholipase L1 biosynthesis ATPase subunit
METIIKLDNIVKRSGYSHFLLRGANLTIQRAERVRIIGARYSGMTEIMKLIGGLIKPDHGEVNVLGIPVHELNEKQAAEFRKKHIGYSSHEPGFLPEFTVLENVTLPLRFQECSKDDREQIGIQILKSIGLAHIIYAFPKGISELEMRLAGIARAFVTKPEIVILNNVSAGVDDEEDKLSKAIETLCSCSYHTLLLFTEDEKEKIPINREICVESGTVRR